QCYTRNNDVYRGSTSTTQSGLTCQSWSSQYPHSHPFTPSNYSNSDLISNYCRNPGGVRNGPWCYTISSHHSWEYCNIQLCASPPSSTAESCYTGNGEFYHGTIRTAVGGLSCEPWSLFNTTFNNQTGNNFVKNYCRNPIGMVRNRPWCYTNSTTGQWKYCNVEKCIRLPISGSTYPLGSYHGEFYRGTENYARNGSVCQNWHSFNLTTSYATANHLMSNYCRNPLGSTRNHPWCFTDTLTRQWQYCNISRCNPLLIPTPAYPSPPFERIDTKTTCYTNNGEFYRGSISTTEKGQQCISWSSKSLVDSQFHQTNYSHPTLVSNYCRNVNGTKQKPWCYIHESNNKWQYCNIPKCN
ncbi:uncharacterized protein TRIADDRAFT_10520, partial [Trichoplax adhaerens]